MKAKSKRCFFAFLLILGVAMFIRTNKHWNRSNTTVQLPDAAQKFPDSRETEFDISAGSPLDTTNSPEDGVSKISASGAFGTNDVPPINRPVDSVLELVWMPPGIFRMEHDCDVQSRLNREGSVMIVRISKGFWIGKYEVTIEQYRKLKKLSPWPREDYESQGPANNVTWEDATNFCYLLTRSEKAAGRVPEGYVYRLPTQAEWEYVCRAGTSTRFSFGDDQSYSLIGAYAWFAGNSEGKPHRVGTKSPNQWGLYDLEGNVHEWCLDRLEQYKAGIVADPVGPISGKFHSTRGGAWNVPADYCCCSWRGRVLNARLIDVGFRVALAPELALP